ncbi:MAG TPA: serine hydroxymethyltransferase [Candidatus Nanoarchaeia archaeon]|nr:serine hydroxymethyltransferase [Candidatus Nanoarchaeia archaeon]
MSVNDAEIKKLMLLELQRQRTTLQMIPSENYASAEVLNACGSVLNNKYAEGYPKKRYYQGNEAVDQVEAIAIERAKQIFGAEHANVQPYSGSPANLAVYFALLNPGDKVLGMALDMGGHLTHGHKVNFSSRYYNSVQYGVDKETNWLNMDEIRKIAHKEKPKMIISGATAYPRQFDFKEFHRIAEEVGAYSLADISHIAGLIVGGVHPSPFPFTDVVMTTTHKTLRGPRGAIILCKKEDRLASINGLDEKEILKAKDLARKIDGAVFPNLQGGPHQHSIAAKAIAFYEAAQPEFRDYAEQIVKNAKVLAETLMLHGVNLVTGGTDNHLILINLIKTKGVEKPGLGKAIATALEKAGIVANANTVPFDPSPPFKPSGIRLGTPALTTQGMLEPEMKEVGELIATVISNYEESAVIARVKAKVEELCKRFPLYKEWQNY